MSAASEYPGTPEGPGQFDKMPESPKISATARQYSPMYAVTRRIRSEPLVNLSNCDLIMQTCRSRKLFCSVPVQLSRITRENRRSRKRLASVSSRSDLSNVRIANMKMSRVILEWIFTKVSGTRPDIEKKFPKTRREISSSRHGARYTPSVYMYFRFGKLLGQRWHTLAARDFGQR